MSNDLRGGGGDIKFNEEHNQVVRLKSIEKQQKRNDGEGIKTENRCSDDEKRRNQRRQETLLHLLFWGPN